MKTSIAIALAACTVLLASCGGGGGTTASTTTTGVPASAQASGAGLVAYIQQLFAGNNDTDEPVSLENVTLTTEDTADALPI